MSNGLLQTHSPRDSDRAERLRDIVQQVLNSAKAKGVDQAEAVASEDWGLSVTARQRDVETVEHNHDRGVTLTVYVNGAKGSANSADFSQKSIAETVDTAVSIARHTESDPCNGLADAELMAKEARDLDLWHPRDLSTDDAIAMAIEAESAALDYDPAISNSEGGSVSSHAAISIYANSHGFLGHYQSTRHGASVVCIAGEGDGMERDWWYTSARSANDLEALQSVGVRAAQRTLKRLNARQVKTCQAPVLFVPEVARGLIGHLVGAVRGTNLYRRSSFLLDAKGESIFPEFVTISERPFLERGFGSSCFDSEGVATRERELIDQGVLTGYVLASYSARRLGLQTTGNGGGVHNLILKPGSDDFDALVTGMDKGLIVTEVMGQGVNLVTGDYSRGASGYWVENGEIQYPVSEITVAGNLRQMFQQIEALGSDMDERSNIRNGSILVGQMTIAGE